MFKSSSFTEATTRSSRANSTSSFSTFHRSGVAELAKIGLDTCTHTVTRGPDETMIDFTESCTEGVSAH